MGQSVCEWEFIYDDHSARVFCMQDELDEQMEAGQNLIAIIRIKIL